MKESKRNVRPSPLPETRVRRSTRERKMRHDPDFAYYVLDDEDTDMTTTEWEVEEDSESEEEGRMGRKMDRNDSPDEEAWARKRPRVTALRHNHCKYDHTISN